FLLSPLPLAGGEGIQKKPCFLQSKRKPVLVAFAPAVPKGASSLYSLSPPDRSGRGERGRKLRAALFLWQHRIQ
ncbi:unnamed protein product, partial [marine sediment metagenome]